MRENFTDSSVAKEVVSDVLKSLLRNVVAILLVALQDLIYAFV